MKPVVLVVILFTIIQGFLTFQPKLERKPIYIPPSKNIEHFSFGYNDFLSSLMWVRVVQDFHVCDQDSRTVKYPALVNKVDPLGEVLERKLPKSRCEKGWVFQMLDVISELSPDFKAVYLDGATMLSILVDDRKGAKTIFDKGRKQYPEDWQILYRSAYHELFEMQNIELAAELMRRAGEHGAPQWVFSLSAKLLTRMGRAQFAKTILESVLQRDSGGKYRERLKKQLEAVDKALRGL